MSGNDRENGNEYWKDEIKRLREELRGLKREMKGSRPRAPRPPRPSPPRKAHPGHGHGSEAARTARPPRTGYEQYAAEVGRFVPLIGRAAGARQ